MRHNITDSELREQLKAEIARFKELDKQKNAAWESLAADNIVSLQEWELLKAQWKDSAEEIKHLHRKLYPNFPSGTCGNCGSVTTPILGSGRNHYGCVACGEETIV
jgi:hypothetical protein